jgi:hypothetical protein
MNVSLQTMPWLGHLVTGGPGSNRAGPHGVCGGQSFSATCFFFFSKSFRFPMSVTFRQCSELIFIFKMTLGRMKSGGPSKINGAVAEIEKRQARALLSLFCFVRTQTIQLNAALQLWPNYEVRAARPVM